ncbi:MAG TPA: hypothetical protein VG778_12570 [Blastocatellia bacterium]|nr:hypothetical protein [Blastocatellia bacterium]
MIIKLSLNHLVARLAFLAAALCALALLVALIGASFIKGALADERANVSRDVLSSAVRYFPDSARLQGRLAAAELLERDRDLARAESTATNAIRLSPHDYTYRLTLAAIKEAHGDRPAAEFALREALRLAPGNINAHWQLANALVRQGKVNESLPEFRIATSANESLLAGTLDLVWRVSEGSAAAVDGATGTGTKARITLARFLVQKGRPSEAAEVFRGLKRTALLGSAESGKFISELTSAGALDTARDLWVDLKGGDSQAAASPIWNGGFESDILRDFAQFDWNLSRSDYARFTLDSATAHSGTRSLRVDFSGRDTTRLNGEIKQLVVLKPGTRYRLECFAKSLNLETPEGPKVVVIEGGSTVLASSAPLAAGSGDWQRVALEFVTSPGSPGKPVLVQVMIQRHPRYAYDDPTLGTLWFDDFAIAGLVKP